MIPMLKVRPFLKQFPEKYNKLFKNGIWKYWAHIWWDNTVYFSSYEISLAMKSWSIYPLTVSALPLLQQVKLWYQQAATKNSGLPLTHKIPAKQKCVIQGFSSLTCVL